MSGNRWAVRVLRGLVAAAAVGVVGCKQQLFIEPGDYTAAVTANLPRSIELNPHAAINPPPIPPVDGGPTTVIDPARPPRYITLKEAIAIALEQGNVGSQSPNQPGFKSDQQPSFFGQVNNATDAIRAFALDPANTYANVERSLSKFDARWISSMTWQKVDQPVAAQFLSFQQQRDAASLNTTLAKPLPTGGTAGITFSVDYSKFATQSVQQAGFINPNYTPRVQFSLEQPLLQLFGVEVNQLTQSHPGSSLIQGLRPSGGQGVEGILITRIRFDQSRTQFESQVNYLLWNVEAAYWNLYSAYYNLYAQEEGYRQAYEGYRFARARVEAGTDPPQLLNQAAGQLYQFEALVVTARGQVLESERNFRGLLGLRSDDGHRLVPVDEPNLAQFTPDYYDAVNTAMSFRPELMLARQELKVQQLNLELQKNLRKPDLRTFGQYDAAGLGTRLDGSERVGDGLNTLGNAFSSLANNQFNSWTVGLRLDMPLGFRDANAQVRSANLVLARSYIQLRDSELKAAEQVVQQYRRVVETYRLLAPTRARRIELKEYTVRNQTLIEQGQFRSTDYFNFLQVSRDLATAISNEFQAIALYNTALASLEWSKGTIMRYNNVSLAEAGLPAYVGKRAADHERERTDAAIKLRERPAHDPAPLSPPHGLGPAVGTPFLPQLADYKPVVDMPKPADIPPMKLPAPGSDAPPAGTPPAPLPKPREATPPGGPPAAYLGGRPSTTVGTWAPPPGGTTYPAPGGSAFPAPDAIFTPTGQTVPTPRLPEISLPQRSAPMPVSEMPPGAAPPALPATLPTIPQRP